MGTTHMILPLLLASASSVLSASLGNQANQFTITENIEALPRSVGPSFVHQGSNFFFNPHMQFSLGQIPNHIESVLDSIQKNTGTYSIENKQEVTFNKEETENLVLPIKNTLGVSIEEDVLRKAIGIKEVPVLLAQDSFDSTPVIIEEIKIDNLPEAPILPPLNLNVLESVATEEFTIHEEDVSPCENPGHIAINQPELVIEMENTPEIIIEDIDNIKKEQSAYVNNKSESIIHELLILPEAPTLPPLTLDMVESIAISKEDVSPCETPGNIEVNKITALPVLQPSEHLNRFPLPEVEEVIVEENFNIPSTPLLISNEPKEIVEIEVPIPEAPILPPLEFDTLIEADITEQIDNHELVNDITSCEEIIEIENNPNEDVNVMIVEGSILIENTPEILKKTPKFIIKEAIADATRSNELRVQKMRKFPSPQPIEVIIEEDENIRLSPMPINIFDEIMALPVAVPLSSLSHPIHRERNTIYDDTRLSLQDFIEIPKTPAFLPISLDTVAHINREKMNIKEIANVRLPNIFDIPRQSIILEEARKLSPSISKINHEPYWTYKPYRL